MKRKYMMISYCVFAIFFMLVVVINLLPDKNVSGTPELNTQENEIDENFFDDENLSSEDGEQGKEYADAKMILGEEDLAGFKKVSTGDNVNLEISNVNIKKMSKLTSVTGTIKNTDIGRNVVIKVEFYNGENPLGSSSILLERIEKNESKDFVIKVANNIVSDDYRVFVDYVGE